MNNHDPLEVRLKALQPAAPPPALMARLQNAEPIRQNMKTLRGDWRWLYLGAAACLVAGLLATYTEQPKPESKPEPKQLVQAPISATGKLEPIAYRRYLIGAKEVGVIDLDSKHPMRLMHVRWLDHDEYRTNDDHEPIIRVARTRDQIIPVAMDVD